MIKLAIFDLDGTLYDYEVCNELAEEKLKEYCVEKLEINENDFAGLLKQAKDDTKNQLGNVAAAHNRLLYMQRICELTEHNPFDFAMDMYNVYWDTMLEEMKLFEYVIPLFEELKNSGIKIALLTDLTAHIQYRKVGKLGIGKYIDYVVTSEEAGEEKPSEKMFKKMLEKAKVISKEAVMIGDSKSRDIEGASNLGIKTVLYLGGDISINSLL